MIPWIILYNYYLSANCLSYLALSAIQVDDQYIFYLYLLFSSGNVYLTIIAMFVDYEFLY